MTWQQLMAKLAGRGPVRIVTSRGNWAVMVEGATEDEPCIAYGAGKSMLDALEMAVKNLGEG